MNERDHVERVLKAAGPRERPPAEIEHELRESLRGEWRAAVATQRMRRRRAAFALAAGMVAAAVGALLVAPDFLAPGTEVGTVALRTGELSARSGALGGWERADAGQSVTTGQSLATGSAGRAALALAGGLSARLDHATEVRVETAGRLVIRRGAVYVDAGSGGGASAAFEIRTPAGTFRHLGTQYEVRVTEAGVRLRVREGRVAWVADGGTATGEAGEQLTIDHEGQMSRGRVAPHGDDWDWTAAAAPAIDVEGLPLDAFLSWAARELGCRIDFATPEVAQEAGTVILHGSVAGLTPAQALQAVFATTRMVAIVQGGSIRISARP